MGADQSSSSSRIPKSASMTSDDIPYTSYAHGKPIGDSPHRQAPKRQQTLSASSTAANTASAPRDLGRKDRSQADSPLMRKTRSVDVNISDIVVVSKGSPRKRAISGGERDLTRLQAIKPFYPLIRGALSLTSLRESETRFRIDAEQALHLCELIQRYLRMCSETVAHDQAPLAGHIREVNFLCTSVQREMTNRHRAFVKHCEQIAAVDSIKCDLDRIAERIERQIHTMNELNHQLPKSVQSAPLECGITKNVTG